MNARALYNILSKLPGDVEVVVGDQLAEIHDATYEDGLLVLECLTDTKERPSTTSFLTHEEENES